MAKTALAIRHVLFEDLGVLDPLLRERGYEITYLDAGVDPIDAETCTAADLLVVLGGPIGVYQEHDFPLLTQEKAALKARLAAGGRTLGICLGAQLLADVLGADVSSTGRTEIGYGRLTLTDAGRDSVLAPLDGAQVLHWHGDQFQIPDGAQRLAETPGFPNQAFALGGAVLGLQFHLEADPGLMERWLIAYTSDLSAAGLDPATIRAGAAAYGPRLRELTAAVLDRWLRD